MPDDPRLEQLERRVKADPASVAFAALAEEYRRAGRYQDAIDTCRTGLSRHPAYLSARVTLGRALIEVGALDEAKAELAGVLKAAPENLAAIRGLAEIHHRRGEIPEAAEHYKSAIEIAEQAAQAGGSIGEILTIDQIAADTRPSAAPGAGVAALPALQAFLDAILAERASRARP